MSEVAARNLRAGAIGVGALALALGAAAVAAPRLSPVSFVLACALVGLPTIGFVLYASHPAVLLCAGVALSMFSGNWNALGFPNLVAPDRILLAAAAIAMLVRAPGARDRPPIELEPIHVLLALTVAYVAGSNIAAGHGTDLSSWLRIFDRIGIVPFVIFVLAPFAFPTARERSWLLATLVAVGAYLSATAVLEVTKTYSLVFPRYIADPTVGIHFDRARGPFVEAVANGTALYAAGVAAVIGAVTWRGAAKKLAVVVAAACTASLVLTLTRSVWVGTLAATALTALAVPRLRRWFVPGAVAFALLVAAPLIVLPGFAARAQSRDQDQQTVWDRYNLNRAALNMVEQRPLFGYGWGSFADRGTDFFRLGPDYPLTAGVGTGIHSAVFSHLAELGLIGTFLWGLSTILVPAMAILRRGPPELDAWRAGLLAYALFWWVVANFVYPYMFSVLILWLLAGVLWTPPSRRGSSARAEFHVQ